jgi:hypothetical protein
MKHTIVMNFLSVHTIQLKKLLSTKVKPVIIIPTTIIMIFPKLLNKHSTTHQELTVSHFRLFQIQMGSMSLFIQLMTMVSPTLVLEHTLTVYLPQIFLIALTLVVMYLIKTSVMIVDVDLGTKTKCNHKINLTRWCKIRIWVLMDSLHISHLLTMLEQ